VEKAARFGRVDTLFSPLGIQRWGQFRTQKWTMELYEEPTLENEDLLNFAVIQTLLNSGQVFMLQPDEIPGNGELATILRYVKLKQLKCMRGMYPNMYPFYGIRYMEIKYLLCYVYVKTFENTSLISIMI